MSNLLALIPQSDLASSVPAEQRRLDHTRAMRTSTAAPAAVPEPIAVRVLGSADAAALERLAGLDSTTVPAGHVLGAEIDGRLVAAVSLGAGEVISDPFRASRAAVELLQLRARQLRAPRRGLPRLRRRRRAHARAGLAGSPPGAGGKLLQL